MVKLRFVIQYESIDGWSDCDGMSFRGRDKARRSLAAIRARNADTFPPETWRMVRRTITETVEE